MSKEEGSGGSGVDSQDAGYKCGAPVEVHRMECNGRTVRGGVNKVGLVT